MLRVNERIEKFSVRESKTSRYIQLPEKVIKSVETDWEPRQLDLYEQIRDDLKVAVIVKEGIPTEDRAEDLLKRLLRLVQIASNPALIDESYKVDPGKFSYLLDIIETIIGQNEKCIVWMICSLRTRTGSHGD